MAYTISWKQLSFPDDKYKIITELIPKVINVSFTVEKLGFVVGDNDIDCLCIKRDANKRISVTTNGKPFTKNVIKTLIIMVEYDVAINVDYGNINIAWFFETIDEVHAINPLESYEDQKEYFNLK